MSGSLEGMLVLELAHMMQGPWAAEMLADFGARVIKIEHPANGERGRQSGTEFVAGHSAQFLAMNRNKESVAVDLKSPDGMAVVRQLVERADALVVNFRPGVLDRLGLGWDDVHALNPRLVYGSASGYGRHVPDPQRPGQDLLAQARTGAMWLTGTATDPPTPAGPYIADIHAATMLALGVTAALAERERTGLGRLVEVDLVGAMLHLQTQEIVAALNAAAPARPGVVAGNPFLEAPYGVYACSDGWLALSLTAPDTLAEALMDPGLVTQFPDKTAATTRRDELAERVAAQLAEDTVASWIERFDHLGVWCAPVNDYASMREDPYVDLERRTTTVEHPDAAQVRLVHNPVRMDDQPARAELAPPRLGEHTHAVLTELGWSGEKISELARSGAIGGHR